MKNGIILLSLLMMGGCVAPQQQYTNFWKKDGVNYDLAVTAHANCQYEVGMAKLESSVEKQQMLEACMMKDNYRWGKYTNK